MPQENNRKAQTFEPRVGIAQLVFGLIYAFITGIAVVLAFKSLRSLRWTTTIFTVFICSFICHNGR